MNALQAIGSRLGVVAAVLLSAPGAQAGVFLYAPSDWVRGTTITIEARADTDVPLAAFEFHSKYVPAAGLLDFLGVLELQNDPKLTLPWPIACGSKSFCNRFEDPSEVEDISVFANFLGTTVPAGTVVQWEFMVKPDAPLGAVTFPIVVGGPLTVEVDSDLANWAQENQQFQVVAIPEPASWFLMLAGMGLVGARAFRRRSPI